jgi:hypothetical protein
LLPSSDAPLFKLKPPSDAPGASEKKKKKYSTNILNEHKPYRATMTTLHINTRKSSNYIQKHSQIIDLSENCLILSTKKKYRKIGSKTNIFAMAIITPSVAYNSQR